MRKTKNKLKLTCSLVILSSLFILLSGEVSPQEANIEDMKKNPQRYIEIENWGLYVAARVAIVHH